MQSKSKRQEESIEKWRSAGGRGIVVAGTGFGKSYMAVTLINKLLAYNKSIPTDVDYPVIVLVPTNALKDSWNKSLKERCISSENVWVETIQKMALHSTEVYKCALLIIDEVHRVASQQFLNVFKFVAFKYFLGLTATINRNDFRDLILTNKFPIVDNISVEECLENNWIAPVKIYKVYIEPDDIDYYYNHNEKFKEFFNYFSNDFKVAMKCIGPKGHIGREEFLRFKYPDARTEQQKKAVRSIINANVFGFMNELKIRKSYIYNHPDKIRITEKIVENLPKSKIITFSKTIKTADKIKPDVENCFYLHSGKTKKKNHITLQEFNELPYGVINSGKMLEEGITVPNLNVGVLVSYDSSRISMIQKLGRILRYEEGKEALLFILVIKNTVEESWLNKAIGNMSYETLDEEQLDNMLNGKAYIPIVDRKKSYFITV